MDADPAAARFVEHFTDPLYGDEGNDHAPFGNDEGSDLLHEWIPRAAELTGSSTIRDVLATASDDPDGLLEELQEGGPDFDQILIGAGFTLLRLTGHINPQDKQTLLAALRRSQTEYGAPENATMIHDLETFTRQVTDDHDRDHK